MRTHGILNAPLLGHIGRLGHTDLVVVADCGLPVPRDVPVVDLALTFGVPSFVDVLDALLGEVTVEGWTAATETTDGPVSKWLNERTARIGEAPKLRPHSELKQLVATADLVVRTGEATPYANVVLRCGVPF